MLIVVYKWKILMLILKFQTFYDKNMAIIWLLKMLRAVNYVPASSY